MVFKLHHSDNKDSLSGRTFLPKGVGNWGEFFKGMPSRAKDFLFPAPTKDRLKLVEDYNVAVSKSKREVENFLNNLDDNKLKSYFHTLKGGKANVDGLSASLKKTGVAAKAASVGMKAASIAMNMALSMGIGYIVGKGFEFFDYLINRSEILAEKARELTSAWKESREEVKKNGETISSISSDYETLAKGVDNFGRNIALTTEEYKQYNNIVNQIAEMFPSMVQGYTDEGNAIIKNKGNIEALTKANEEFIKSERRRRLEGAGDVWKGTSLFQDRSYKTEFQNWLGFKPGLTGETIYKDSAEELKHLEYILKNQEHVFRHQRLFQTGFSNAGLDISKSFVDGFLTDNAINKITLRIRDLNGRIESELAPLKTIFSDYLAESFSYQKLDEDAQKIVDTIVASFDFDFLKDFDSEQEVYNWIDTSILYPLTDPKTGKEAQKAVANIFNNIVPSKDSISAKEWLDAFNSELEKLPEEMQIKIKAVFSDDIEGIETLQQQVASVLLKQFGAKDSRDMSLGLSGILTTNQLKLLVSNFEDLGITVDSTVDDIVEKVKILEREIKSSVSATAEEIKTLLEDIKDPISSLESIIDTYNKEGGVLSVDSIVDLLKEYPHFVKYLVLEGDQYKLNTLALEELNIVKEQQVAVMGEYIEKLKEQEFGTREFTLAYDEFLSAITEKYDDENLKQFADNIKDINSAFLEGKYSVDEYFENLQNQIGLISHGDLFGESVSEGMQAMFAGLTMSTASGIEYLIKQFSSGQMAVEEFTKSMSQANNNLLDLHIAANGLTQGRGLFSGMWVNASGEVDEFANGLVDASSRLETFNPVIDTIVSNIDYLSEHLDAFGNAAFTVADESSEAFKSFADQFEASLESMYHSNNDAFNGIVNDVASANGMMVEDIVNGSGDIADGLFHNSKAMNAGLSSLNGQLGKALTSAASAAGGVIEKLGDVISEFKYNISFKFKGTSGGEFNPLKWMRTGGKEGFSLPQLNWEIGGKAEKGSSIGGFVSSLKSFGGSLNAVDFSEISFDKYLPKNNYVPKALTPTTTGGSKGGGGSGGGKGSSKEIEEYIADIDKHREALRKLQQVEEKREALERKAKSTEGYRNRVALQRQLIDAYGKEQEALDSLIVARRETISDSVSSLRKLGFEVEHNAQSNDLYIKNLEHLNTLTAKSKGKHSSLKEATNALRKETEELIKETESLNDANKKSSSSIEDLTQSLKKSKDNILSFIQEVVSSAEDGLNSITGAYAVLVEAASSFKQTGFLTIKTFQDILSLGTDYLAFLYDENGAIKFNEKAIKDLTVAKVENLAISKAMALVDTIKEYKGNTRALKELAGAADEASDAVWSLVYSDLVKLRYTDKIIDDNLYFAFLHQLEMLKSMANKASQSIDELSNSFSGGYDGSLSALDEIISLTMDLIRYETDTKIKGINKQVEAYRKIIDLKKEEMGLNRDEDNHNKKVSEKNKEIADIQSRISRLSLDNSREARAEVAHLQEQLKERQEELHDIQSDYAYDAQIKALDKMVENFEESKQEEIEILEDSVSSHEKLYREAIDRIGHGWDDLYGDLIAWNYEAGSTLESEITNKWEGAIGAAEEYGNILEAITELERRRQEQGKDPGNTVWEPEEPETDKEARPVPTGDIDGDGKVTAVDARLALRASAGLEDLEDWQLEAADFNRDGKISASEARYILRMSAGLEDPNDIMGDIDRDGKVTEADAAIALRASAGLINLEGRDKRVADVNRDGKVTAADSRLISQIAQGKIEILPDGTIIEIHHEGGIVGNKPKLKDNEVLAILEKEEAVLNKEKKESLYEIVDVHTALSKKLGVDVGKIQHSSLLKGTALSGQIHSPAIPHSIDNSESFVFSPNIEVNIQGGEGITEDSARRNGEIIADMTLDKLASAFNKRGLSGIGNSRIKQ